MGASERPYRDAAVGDSSTSSNVIASDDSTTTTDGGRGDCIDNYCDRVGGGGGGGGQVECEAGGDSIGCGSSEEEAQTSSSDATSTPSPQQQTLNQMHKQQQQQQEQQHITTTTTTKTMRNPPTPDDIYDFYTTDLIPAVLASIPILLGRIGSDLSSLARLCWERTIEFLLPRKGWIDDAAESLSWSAPSLASLWNQQGKGGDSADGAGGGGGGGGGNGEAAAAEEENSAFVEFMLRHFDTDGDGHISASELLRMGDYRLPNYTFPPRALETAMPSNWFAWLSTAWPAMDWKLGVFLWRTCGGLLIVIVICTIVPGRLHGYSRRILRWPILALTYFMIAVELAVYTMIRMFIRLVEWAFANPKHRALRNRLKEAKSYDEWYRIASELDMSQKRDGWRKTTNDGTSYRYNWSFVKELMNDMRSAREQDDSLMALAVLQQCTRKNVGGVMSEDLFAYTNTGEPKYIVSEFIEEVVTTLRWVTERAIEIPLPRVREEEGDVDGRSRSRRSGEEEKTSSSPSPPSSLVDRASRRVGPDRTERAAYERDLQFKVKEEKTKIYGSLIGWATATFLGGGGEGEKLDENRASAKSGGLTGNEMLLCGADCADGLADAITVASVAPSKTGSAKEGGGGGGGGGDGGGRKKSEIQLPFLHREQVKTFLKRARAAYGRTALCLSGGAMMGNYHFGHVQALIEQDALPHIISGTSAGSVVAAMLCTRTREELERDMRPEVLVHKLICFSKPWADRFRGVMKNGCLFDFEDWIELIQWFTCGNMTFEEAYKKTGRVFCITLSATTKRAPPVLVNHITAPNVTLASAIIASAAVPGFIKPVRLQLKGPDGVVRVQAENKDQTYWDGSIEQDIPTSGLAEMLNCQFFIAAQCNPHIVPFLFNTKGDVGRPSRWSSGIRGDSWRGGFLLSALELYLKTDMVAKFHFLNEVDAAIGFFGTMFTQSTYTGTTTIVPNVVLQDFFKLFSDPKLSDMHRYFQAGSVAAYQHIAMIKLHYRIAHALDECLAILERTDESNLRPRRRRSQLAATQAKLSTPKPETTLSHADDESWTPLTNNYSKTQKEEGNESRSTSCATSTSSEDEEVEDGGFDGIDLPIS